MIQISYIYVLKVSLDICVVFFLVEKPTLAHIVYVGDVFFQKIN